MLLRRSLRENATINCTMQVILEVPGDTNLVLLSSGIFCSVPIPPPQTESIRKNEEVKMGKQLFDSWMDSL